jgi:hypothetical protein
MYTPGRKKTPAGITRAFCTGIYREYSGVKVCSLRQHYPDQVVRVESLKPLSLSRAGISCSTPLKVLNPPGFQNFFLFKPAFRKMSRVFVQRKRERNSCPLVSLIQEGF